MSSYCLNPSDSLFGSTLSRDFRYNPINRVQLEKRGERTRIPRPQTTPIPTAQEKKEGCKANIGNSVKTGNWEEFKISLLHPSGIWHLLQCLFWLWVLILVLVSVALGLGFSAPFLAPIFDILEPIIRPILSVVWSVFKIPFELMWAGIKWVQEFTGANEYLVILDLVTGALWALGALLRKFVGVYQLWEDSDMGKIYSFLDEPLEIIELLAENYGPLVAWMVWIFLVPFKVLMLGLSTVIGGVWELAKWGWKLFF